MTENSPLHTDNFNTVIHRSPGLGQDLDWLKSLQAEKILLVTRDRTNQRRLRLQTLTDARFVVLTEDEASAAQIQELQERVNTLEAENAEAETRVEQAESQISQLEAEVTSLRSDHEAAFTALQTEQDTVVNTLKQQTENQAAQITALTQERDELEKELRTTQALVELLRDCLVSQEAQEAEPPNE
jgi:chromosome segregation ATPase